MVPTYPMGAEQDDAATPPQRTTAETMHTADLRTQVTLPLQRAAPEVPSGDTSLDTSRITRESALQRKPINIGISNQSRNAHWILGALGQLPLATIRRTDP